MRRRASGGTGGWPMGAPAADWWGCRIFFIFYVFQKCSLSVGFTRGKLFAECP